MWVYIWTGNPLQNAYIGEYVETPFTPWANTLAYYPLEWDLNDYSGNGYTLTNAWGAIFKTDSWIERTVLYFNWAQPTNYSPWNAYVYTQSLPSSTTSLITINVWSKPAFPIGESYARGMFDTRFNWNSGWVRWELYQGACTIWINNTYTPFQNASGYFNTWTLWSVTYSKSTWTVKMYLNGSLNNSGSVSSTPWNNWLSNFTLWIGYWGNQSMMYNRNYLWWIGDVILENKIRTDQEIADYYNASKSIYGL